MARKNKAATGQSDTPLVYSLPPSDFTPPPPTRTALPTIPPTAWHPPSPQTLDLPANAKHHLATTKVKRSPVVWEQFARRLLVILWIKFTFLFEVRLV